MHISATELNKRPGAMLDNAMREPVIIEKSGNPSVVMVSYQRYKELEDAFWGGMAEALEKTASWASPEESLNFLQQD
ncbi:MAG: type II toxin-antitoxin system prevent-host-death family antitoxin [Alphaproteobacteria bacterium]|nr:type II toxin-antitoxin system prevent-host-death family antitoxin [Alphaproteobacteria bacterium]